MNKIENIGRKIVLFAGILALSWLLFGSVSQLVNLPNVEESVSSLMGFAGIFVLIQLILLVIFLFRLIEKIALEKQNIITIIVLALMSLIFVFLICKFHPVQGTDAFDDLDTAMHIAKNGPVDMDVIHGCIKVFGNNNLMILMFAGYFRILMAIGFTGNVLIPLYVMNAMLMVFSSWLAYATVKRIFEKKTANKVLILLALNPLYYFYIFWIYSPIFSVPIMIGILYLGVRFVKTEKRSGTILCGAGIGILTVLGYRIRVVALFPLLAAIVMIPFAWKRRPEIRKKMLGGSAAFLVMAGIVLLGTSALEKPYFEKVKSENMPIWFWLSLGSHDDGTTNYSYKELRAAAQAETPEQRSEILKKQAIKNYRELGLLGTPKLWLQKSLNNWCDGFSEIAFKISIGETDTRVFELIGGFQNIPFRIYCQAYRAFLFLGMLILCIRYVIGQKMRDFPMLLLITILGSILFYFIWEVKSAYSSPFLVVMGMIAALGFAGRDEEDSPIKLLIGNRKALRNGAIGTYIAFACLSTLIFSMLFCSKRWVEYRRIYTTIDSRAGLTLDNASNIRQDFYTEQPFNRLVLLTNTPVGQDCSTYNVSVYTSKDVLMMSQTVSSANIFNGSLYVNFQEPVSGDSHYYIEIVKNSPEKANIQFIGKLVYYFDNYAGQLIVDGDDSYTGDLKMNVSYLVERRYFGKMLSGILLVGYPVLSSVLLWGFLRSFRWKRMMQTEANATV